MANKAKYDFGFSETTIFKESGLLGRLLRVSMREVCIILRHPIYILSMVLVPILVTALFTTLMEQGQPLEMPVGVVDLDNSSTTRKLIRTLDSFQSSKVVAHYPSVEEARHAIQKGEIYAFMYFPKNTTDDLLASRQPKISFYYTNTSLTAGALLFKDMKTMATLGSAAVGQATLTAKGYRPELIMPVLQPVTIDLHLVGNPWVSYNIFLCMMIIPGCLLLIVFLITTYSFGTEIKFGTAKDLMRESGDNIVVAVLAKMIPHHLIFLAVMYGIMVYLFGILHFPAPGGVGRLALLGFLCVLASQGFGLFMFSLLPTIRMAMSICSLWGVLSFSMVGSAYPVLAMDAPLQALSWLFPLRHYYVIYHTCVLNAYPLSDVAANICVLLAFGLMPWLLVKYLGHALRHYEYMQ